MSNDEQIQNLLMAGLDKQGVLTKVKAQVKASVYKILDQNTEKKGGVSNYFWENPKGAELHKNKQLVLMLEIVKEFLQFFDFDYTLSVFQSECNLKEFIKRDTLCEKIGINKKDIDSQKPILLHIFQQFTSGGKVILKPSGIESTGTSREQDVKAQPVKAYDMKQKKSELPTSKPQQQNNAKGDKFNSMQLSTETSKTKKKFEFEEIEEDDVMGSDLEDSQPQKQKKQKENPLYTSSEDFMASQSQGFDITVDSADLDKYDHVEKIYHKK